MAADSEFRTWLKHFSSPQAMVDQLKAKSE
jgi:hypothetical protein